MIKATIRERYISSENGIAHEQVKEIIHESRIFSTEQKFDEWLQSFKHELWQDDPAKVKLVEGIYVDKQEIKVDDVTPPKQIRKYATFRKGVSYYYASEGDTQLVS
uniref:Uncharacterized protein n=1 Tax=Roseihalotalea indica TaxID=2867963 RepID=A0AA49GQR5_9BACT|nr:hypothetical protein K4G66_30165 [Tunicatimonas sp. TK19036]